jgi:hypothetical protein
LCEQEVASATQQEEWSLQVLRNADCIALIVIDDILVTLLINIKGVVVQQRMILLYLHVLLIL